MWFSTPEREPRLPGGPLCSLEALPAARLPLGPPLSVCRRRAASLLWSCRSLCREVQASRRGPFLFRSDLSPAPQGRDLQGFALIQQAAGEHGDCPSNLLASSRLRLAVCGAPTSLLRQAPVPPPAPPQGAHGGAFGLRVPGGGAALPTPCSVPPPSRLVAVLAQGEACPAWARGCKPVPVCGPRKGNPTACLSREPAGSQHDCHPSACVPVRLSPLEQPP